MSKTPEQAAIYCRISKDSTGKSLGVERQRDLCEKLAAEKGWQVAEVYVDNDLSAYSGAPRPEYERMLADIEVGTVDGVLVVDQDRLTRHPMELESFIIAADSAGVPIANVAGEVDLSSSDGRFRARIMGAVARQESEKKSERVKRQKDQSASHGWYQGGRRPYGFSQTRTKDGFSTLTIIDSEAKVVREMAHRVIAGDSLRTIAADLNERRIPTASGKEWRVTTIRATLTGASVAGLRVHQGEIVGPANWDAILDRATWEQVRAVLDTRGRGKVGRPATHLLTGLLECSKCGGTLYFRRRGYVCQPNPERQNCGGTSISVQVEDIVVGRVLDKLAEADIFSAIAEAPSEDIEVITTEIESGEAALDQLARDHYSDELISRREYMAAREAVEGRLAELRAKLPAVNRPVDIQLPRDRGQLAEVWSEMSFDDHREILQLVIAEAVVYPGVKGRHTVDPERVKIKWREKS